MNIDDGRVLAISGAMLGEGRFEFEGAETAGFMQAPQAMVMLRDRPGWHGTEFSLVADARRDPDGLWSAGQPLHFISLQSTLPPLYELLDYPSFGFVREGVLSNVARFDLAAEHSAFAWVAVDAVFDPSGQRKSLLGMANRVSIEAQRDAEGLSFMVEAHVDKPRRGEVEAAPFTVRAFARLSFATLALAGSGLWWRGPAERWALPAEGQTGPLAQVLTLDRAGGTPLFRGILDLGPAQSEYTRGPWVKAYVSDRRLRLIPHRELKESRGFVSSDNYGQELIFDNLGTAAWETMLEGRDEAVLEQSGVGIGHVEGVTGRDAGEFGPHEQPITSARIRLSRLAEGLRIAFEGELGEVRQKATQPPLGPEVRGDFLVPNAFLLARGVRLGNVWAERRALLGTG